MLQRDQLEALSALVGHNGLRAGDIASTLERGVNEGNLNADVVVFPDTVPQLQAVVRYCNEQRISMVPHGGRTGISGGGESCVGQIIVQTTRLHNILNIDAEAGTAVVESGVTLEQLQSALRDYELTVGVDLGARGTATLGGMVSTNAGGTDAFRHGVMRQQILGLEAVLPDGRVFDDLKQVVKANEGFDVKQLLIGAEGTLGIVTKLAVKLVPAAGNRVSALVSCRDVAAALALLRRLRSPGGSELLCIEVMWPDYARITADELKMSGLLAFEPDQSALFVILDVAAGAGEAGRDYLETALTDAFEDNQILGAVIAKNERERSDFWLVRDESFLCDRRYPHGFWYDISVPHRHLEAYVRDLFRRVEAIRPDFKVFLFGHLGDGNLHLTVTAGESLPELEPAVEEAVYAGLGEVGGSFSAEHGIGAHKRHALKRYCSPEKMEIMGNIKKLLDPNNVMNPAKVL